MVKEVSAKSYLAHFMDLITNPARTPIVILSPCLLCHTEPEGLSVSPFFSAFSTSAQYSIRRNGPLCTKARHAGLLRNRFSIRSQPVRTGRFCDVVHSRKSLNINYFYIRQSDGYSPNRLAFLHSCLFWSNCSKVSLKIFALL